MWQETRCLSQKLISRVWARGVDFGLRKKIMPTKKQNIVNRLFLVKYQSKR